MLPRLLGMPYIRKWGKLQEAVRPIRGSPYVNTSAYFHLSSSSINLFNFLLKLLNVWARKTSQCISKTPQCILWCFHTKNIIEWGTLRLFCISIALYYFQVEFLLSPFFILHWFMKILLKNTFVRRNWNGSSLYIVRKDWREKENELFKKENGRKYKSCFWVKNWWLWWLCPCLRKTL